MYLFKSNTVGGKVVTPEEYSCIDYDIVLVTKESLLNSSSIGNDTSIVVVSEAITAEIVIEYSIVCLYVIVSFLFAHRAWR
jgi:hypothetical protein